jgi:hypothetical protein
MNRHYPYLSVVGEFLLAPFDEAARCSALGWRDHQLDYATASDL